MQSLQLHFADPLFVYWSSEDEKKQNKVYRLKADLTGDTIKESDTVMLSCVRKYIRKNKEENA